MKKSGQKRATQQQISSAGRRLCLISWLCCLSIYFLTSIVSCGKSFSGSYHLTYSLSPARYHSLCRSPARMPQMLSPRSKSIATATVFLFRRFGIISSFRFSPSHSSVIQRSRSKSTGHIFQHTSSFLASRVSSNSFFLLSHNFGEAKFSVRQYSTSSEQTEEKGPTTKSSSFSVPAMGTDKDDLTDETDYSGYEKWVRRLYATNMFHPVKLGLENMHLLHELLGSPMDDPNRVVVHVAGTNGKGSVCLKIANALRHQERTDASPFVGHDIGKEGKQLNVGIFCSPHVSSFRERMQVNGKMITEEEVTELLPHIYDLCLPENNDIPATFFEITTALAFAFYAKRGADVVVLETGLGGRLDATNVVTNPALSIITSIGLEHTRILGDTIELIAKEKGGIIKKDRPVLVGPHCPHDVLTECAREKGAGRYYTPSLVRKSLQDFEMTPKSIKGSSDEDPADYDKENQDIAKAALVLLEQSHPQLFGKDLTSDEIEHYTSIRPPCRFETLEKDGVTVILDVAHNPSAMDYLVYKLKTTYPDRPFRFVAGMSSDKDLGQCARALLSATQESSRNIHLVQAAHPRAASLEQILAAESSLETLAHYDFDDRSITKQVLQALELAKDDDGEILVVCGSVFLMAETREALGIDEPRDSDYIVEMAGAGIRHAQENFGNTKM